MKTCTKSVFWYHMEEIGCIINLIVRKRNLFGSKSMFDGKIFSSLRL